MAEGRKRLTQAAKTILAGKQDKPRLFPAVLGAYVDGIKQIKVARRADFVWCRMRGSSSEVIQAFNEKVSLHWDLPVLVFRDPLAPGIWKIYGRDTAQYDDWGGASYLPPHGDAHSFSGSDKTGSDPVWVFKRQYMPMLPRPVVSGTLSIFIEADFWYYQGRYYWWPGSGTTSLAPYMPTGATNGAFVTVYMDGPKKIPQFIKGPEFSAWYPPTDPSDFISLPTPVQGPPLAAVFLTTGTSWIGWGEIYDLRSPQESLGSLTASGSFMAHDEGLLLGSVTHLDVTGPGASAVVSGSYMTINVPQPSIMGFDEAVPVGTGTAINVVGKGGQLSISGSVLQLSISGTTIQDEGSPLGFFDTLDFVGAGVSAAVVGTKATVTISATPVSPPITGSFVIEEEGVVLGSATELNFIGASVTATLVGPRADITIAGGAGGGSGTVVVLDDGAVLGSSDWLNFRNGLVVSLSGSYATIDAYIAPLQINNGLGYFTFTGIYVGSPQAELVASQGLASNDVALGANALLQRMAGSVALVANAPGYTASGLTIGTLTLTNRTGTVWIEAYADSLGEPYWFRGMSLGHNAAPRYMLDAAAGTALAGSGFFVRELPGSPQGNLANAEGVFFAKASDGHPYYAAPDGTEYDLATGPAGPAGAGGVMGWDEGIPLGTGTILNVTGDGASLSLSGTVLELNVPGPFLQDEGGPLGYLSALDFVGAGVTATLVGSQATITIPGGGTANPPVTGSFVIAEEGSILGSATELNFIGAAVTATLVGPRANITITASGGGAYPRCGVPILLAGNYYQVPDYPYLSGSLMVFTNGVAQRPVVDFVEWSPASGIFQYVTSPATGSSHVAMWGK